MTRSISYPLFSFLYLIVSFSSPLWATLPVGRFFLVEQPSVQFNSSWLKVDDISRPGGIVFWNSSKEDYTTIQATIQRYSQLAKDRGDDPWLFSIDYEGGALNQTPSGKSVPGVQRITKGLTSLAHPIWLGKSLARFGTELCMLHGKIMGNELSAIGVNYPLTLISDLAYRLFAIRSISKDPHQVSQCMKAFLDGIASADSVIAVTKHFPGLGQTVGDTHDGVSTSTAKTWEEFQAHLLPFKEIIEYAQNNRIEDKLSILSSHGKFPLVDSQNLTTESHTLLTELLVNKLGFSGIRVSDAMWMGDYGKLSGDSLNAVYISSFIAGNDLLMIPGSRYSSALKAFSNLENNSLSDSFSRLLESKFQWPIATIRDRFLARAQESLERLHRTQSGLRHAVDTIVTNTSPTDLSTVERTRYREILSQLGYKSFDPKASSLP